MENIQQLDATSLRIGNLVSDIHASEIFYAKVKRISEDRVYYGEFNCHPKDLKPIPLTEEWLLKFGFVKDKEYNNTFNLGIDILNGFKDFSIDVRAEVLLFDSMEIKIKYVHELQNLFYSLCKRELTYERPTN